jgi:hypothetical protein
MQQQAQRQWAPLLVFAPTHGLGSPLHLCINRNRRCRKRKRRTPPLASSRCCNNSSRCHSFCLTGTSAVPAHWHDALCCFVCGAAFFQSMPFRGGTSGHSRVLAEAALHPATTVRAVLWRCRLRWKRRRARTNFRRKWRASSGSCASRFQSSVLASARKQRSL